MFDIRYFCLTLQCNLKKKIDIKKIFIVKHEEKETNNMEKMKTQAKTKNFH
jgi:hypothetical protein